MDEEERRARETVPSVSPGEQISDFRNRATAFLAAHGREIEAAEGTRQSSYQRDDIKLVRIERSEPEFYEHIKFSANDGHYEYETGEMSDPRGRRWASEKLSELENAEYGRDK